MSRTLTVRVEAVSKGTTLGRPRPVRNVTLDVRTNVGTALEFQQRLAANDADGLITATLPLEFSAPRAVRPVQIRVTAPGYRSSGWMTIPSSGGVSRLVRLRHDDRFEDWDFTASFRAVGTFAGSPTDEELSGIAGRVRFDRRLQHIILGSLDDADLSPLGVPARLSIATPVTGPFDPATGDATLIIEATITPNTNLFNPSVVRVPLATGNRFRALSPEMTGVAKTDRRIRLVGTGPCIGGRLDGDTLFLAMRIVRD